MVAKKKSKASVIAATTPVQSKGEVLAWHFIAGNGKGRNGIKIPKDGEWLVYRDKPVICYSGLHASIKLLDAMQYSPGGTLTRVLCNKPTTERDNKVVCTRRKVLFRITPAQLVPAIRKWSEQVGARVNKELRAQVPGLKLRAISAIGRDDYIDAAVHLDLLRKQKASINSLSVRKPVSADFFASGIYDGAYCYVYEWATHLVDTYHCSFDELNKELEDIVLAMAPKD